MMFNGLGDRIKRNLAIAVALVLATEALLTPLSVQAATSGAESQAPGPLSSQPLDPNAATGGFSKIVIPGQSETPLDLARGKPPKEEREIIERRDAYNSVFAEPDGSFKQRHYTAPHFYQKDGLWELIDTTLVTDTNPTDSPDPVKQLLREISAEIGNNHTYKVTANDWQARIAPSDATWGMIRIQKGALNIVVRPIGANAVNPEIQTDSAGNQFVHYGELWNGVDADYQILGSELKEFLIVKNKTAPSSFTFKIEGAELTPHPTIAGAFSIVGNSDFTLSPVMVDSYKYGPITESVIGQTYADSQLTVTLKQNWLDSLPADAFPLAIDPTWRKVINLS
ncbi:MAG: hypothetical protein AAB613_01870, partial [Patescibacteria group bacterium]